MRSTFKILFYVNKNRVKNDGTTAIMCRITIDGKNSAIATGLYCGLKEWNAKKGEVRNTRINNRLQQFRQDVECRYEEVLRENGVVSAEILKNIIVGANAVPKKLLQAGEVERERLRIRSIEINSTSTYRESKSTQLYLRQFVQSRGMEDIALTDITHGANTIRSQTYSPLLPLLAAALIYLIIVSILSMLVEKLERRLRTDAR